MKTDLSSVLNTEQAAAASQIEGPLLIIAGVVAGYFPARKAVKIPAVEAMRAE